MLLVSNNNSCIAIDVIFNFVSEIQIRKFQVQPNKLNGWQEEGSGEQQGG